MPNGRAAVGAMIPAGDGPERFTNTEYVVPPSTGQASLGSAVSLDSSHDGHPARAPRTRQTGSPKGYSRTTTDSMPLFAFQVDSGQEARRPWQPSLSRRDGLAHGHLPLCRERDASPHSFRRDTKGTLPPRHQGHVGPLGLAQQGATGREGARRRVNRWGGGGPRRKWWLESWLAVLAPVAFARCRRVDR